MGTGPDCIVSYLDLIGTKSEITNSMKSEWIETFNRVYSIIRNNANNSMPMHEVIYYWNDSVLLLALPKSKEDYEPIIKEVNTLKKLIDCVRKSFVVCIKGKTIDDNNYDLVNDSLNSKAIYLRASSMAFANCFEVLDYIEKHNKQKASWYIDKRIVDNLNITNKSIKNRIPLLPRNVRFVYKYNDYLW